MAEKKQKQGGCWLCDGTGKYKKPNDEEEYSRLFDSYSDKAYFINMKEAREKALKDVGYTLVDCPRCCDSESKKTAPGATEEE